MDETTLRRDITHRNEELCSERTSKPEKLRRMGPTRPLKELKGGNDS
jgi:hypothetical protein